MMEYRHCVCDPPRAGGRAFRTPRAGGGPSKKRASKSYRVPLLRHIETPELNSPRTNFLFQDSFYLIRQGNVSSHDP